MTNQYDKGMQQDFDNMTADLGRKCLVYPKYSHELSYEGQTAVPSDPEYEAESTTEIIFMQQLDTENEVVASGEFEVGDARFTFQSTTTIEEEGFVSPDNGATLYKVLKLTRVRNMNNNKVIYVNGFGRKLPNR